MHSWGHKEKIPIATIQTWTEMTEFCSRRKSQEEGWNKDYMIFCTGQHWVLTRYMTRGLSRKVTIFETYPESHRLQGTMRTLRTMDQKGWETDLQFIGCQEAEDGNTCGYHVLRWVKEILDTPPAERKWNWKPTKYEASTWVQKIVGDLPDHRRRKKERQEYNRQGKIKRGTGKERYSRQ